MTTTTIGLAEASRMGRAERRWLADSAARLRRARRIVAPNSTHPTDQSATAQEDPR